MNENKISIQKYAMHFGTYMGIFWIIKFLLVPLAMTNLFFAFLFLGLTFTVPFLAYYLTKSFRAKICGGYISFIQAWVFLGFMFIFASILAALGHYIYFRYLDHGYIISSIIQALDELPKEIPDTQLAIDQMKRNIELMSTMTPIKITMQQLSKNVLNTALLSLIISLFVAKKKNTIQ